MKVGIYEKNHRVPPNIFSSKTRKRPKISQAKIRLDANAQRHVNTEAKRNKNIVLDDVSADTEMNNHKGNRYLNFS